MSYSILIRNEFNDNLVDISEGFSYYKKETGNCFSSADIPILSGQVRGFCPISSYLTDGDCLIKDRIGDGFSEYWNRCRIPAQALTPFSYGSASRPAAYAALSTNINDMVFYKLPAGGLVRMSQYYIDFDIPAEMTDHLSAYCALSSSVSESHLLEYVLVSTDPPASQGNHGVQIFSGGELTFDTTKQIAAFKDTVFLTAAENQNIVENNAVVDKALRVPMDVNDTWISSVYGANWKSSLGSFQNTMDSVRYRIINSTTIRFDRERATGNSRDSATYYRERYEDTLFFITDF